MRAWAKLSCAFLVAIWIGPAFAESRLAFVAGVDRYQNLPPDAQLQRAVSDAQAVGDVLQRQGFAVTRVTGAERLDDLINAFQAFVRSVRPGDTVLFYFAGHGITLGDGNYLVPGDIPALGPADEMITKRHALAERDVKQAIVASGARAAIVILDACRNNPFSVQGTRSLGSGTRGLARIEGMDGVFSLYSAREGQAALDRLSDTDTDANSVFTRVLLKDLQKPGMSLSDLGEDVRDEVAALSRAHGSDQVPAVSNELIGARAFYLAGPAAQPTPVDSAPLPRAPDDPEGKPRTPAAHAVLPQPDDRFSNLWMHNGSIVRLRADGANRVFSYEIPRPGLVEAGAAKGVLLFVGARQADRYDGTAFIFHKGCPAKPYTVTGFVLHDNTVVELRGNAPVIAENCSVSGYKNDILQFYRQNEPPDPVVRVAAPPISEAFRRRVAEYFDAAGAEPKTAYAFMRSVYDSEVEYYGKTLDRDRILAEKLNYLDKWPYRRYVLEEDGLSETCDAGAAVCRVSGVVNWQAGRGMGSRPLEGSARVEMAWRLVGQTWKIIAERSKVIARQPD